MRYKRTYSVVEITQKEFDGVLEGNLEWLQERGCEIVDIKFSTSMVPATEEHHSYEIYGALIIYREPPKKESDDV